MKKPNLFIVGAPRCGTESLWSYLKSHPDIYMSAEKELYFFDADLWPKQRRAPSVKWYLGHFSAACSQKMIGEATPSYLRSQRAAKAIKAFNPAAQIIIMLRNPVDVMHSLHSSALYSQEPLADFEAALQADSLRIGRELVGYREFTNFTEQVQRYLDVFGRENVHTIIYDDSKEDSAAVYQNTLGFSWLFSRIRGQGCERAGAQHACAEASGAPAWSAPRRQSRPSATVVAFANTARSPKF